MLCAYPLLFMFNWFVINTKTEFPVDSILQLEMSILRTTMQPSDTDLWTSNITGPTCEAQLHNPIAVDDVCAKMERINICFIIFLIFKAFSLVFNFMGIYAAFSLIFKHGVFNPLVGGRLSESTHNLLESPYEEMTQKEKRALIAIQKQFLWKQWRYCFKISVFLAFCGLLQWFVFTPAVGNLRSLLAGPFVDLVFCVLLSVLVCHVSHWK